MADYFPQLHRANSSWLEPYQTLRRSWSSICQAAGLSLENVEVNDTADLDSTTVFGDKIRLERIEKSKTMVAQSYSHVSSFYANKMKASNSVEDENASNLLDKVLKLS